MKRKPEIVPLWTVNWGWKNRMATQNRQKSNAKKNNCGITWYC